MDLNTLKERLRPSNWTITENDGEGNIKAKNNVTGEVYEGDLGGYHLIFEFPTPSSDIPRYQFNEQGEITGLDQELKQIKDIEQDISSLYGLASSIVTISGELAVGGTVTAVVRSGWAATSYQWYNNGTPISGATAVNYLVKEGDTRLSVDAIGLRAKSGNYTID